MVDNVSWHEHQQLKSEIVRLRAFAQAILKDFPEGAPDGFDLHDLAVEHGLLEGVEATEPCGENCWCAEWDDFPQTCYRRTPLLTGEE